MKGVSLLIKMDFLKIKHGIVGQPGSLGGQGAVHELHISSLHLARDLCHMSFPISLWCAISYRHKRN